MATTTGLPVSSREIMTFSCDTCSIVCPTLRKLRRHRRYRHNMIDVEPRQQEEAAQSRQQEEEAAQPRQQEEEAAQPRQQEEEAAQPRQQEEEAAQLRQQEEAAQPCQQEEAAQPHQQEEAAQPGQQEQEASQPRHQQEASQPRHQQEEAHPHHQWEEAAEPHHQQEEAAQPDQQEETAQPHHQLEAAPVIPTSFYCEACSRAFPNLRKLKRHKSWLHKELELEVHQQQAAPEIVTFPCETCPKIFPTVRKLKRHTLHKHGWRLMAETGPLESVAIPQNSNRESVQCANEVSYDTQPHGNIHADREQQQPTQDSYDSNREARNSSRSSYQSRHNRQPSNLSNYNLPGQRNGLFASPRGSYMSPAMQSSPFAANPQSMPQLPIRGYSSLISDNMEYVPHYVSLDHPPENLSGHCTDMPPQPSGGAREVEAATYSIY